MREGSKKVTVERKIGQNKGRPRIWLDGKLLAEVGFVGGTVYHCGVRPGEISCRLTDSFDKSVGSSWSSVRSRNVTGRPDGKPIIDILGRDVEVAFPGAERVSVTFEQGQITITVKESV